MFEQEADKELEIKAKEYANTTEFTEYANSSLSESLDISEDIKQAYIAGAKETQEENEKLKQQNEKMRNCVNCKNMIKGTRDVCIGCFNFKHWEIAE